MTPCKCDKIALLESKLADRDAEIAGKHQVINNLHKKIQADAKVISELRKYAEQWRARFDWPAEQHWVQPEATFSLELSGSESLSEYKIETADAVDAAIEREKQ